MNQSIGLFDLAWRSSFFRAGCSRLLMFVVALSPLVACSESAFGPKLNGPLNYDTLLSAPHESPHTCTLARPVTPYAMSGARYEGGLLFARDDGMFLITTEPDSTTEGFKQSVMVYRVDGDGNRTEARTLASFDGFISDLSSAARDGELILAWVEREVDDQARIRLATLDENFELTSEPMVASGVSGNLHYASIAPAQSGVAVVFIRGDADYVDNLSFARLDASGAMLGRPELLSRAKEGLQLDDFVAFGDGYAVAWSRFDSAGGGILEFLDASGASRSGELFTGNQSNGQALLVRGDELLLAFTLFDVPYPRGLGAYELRLARFDRDGERLGVHALDRGSLERFLSTPTLIPYGDDVAVLWSEGTVIRVCGGCMPDNLLKLAVLSGRDPKPASNVIELKNPLDHGGLVRSVGAWKGDDLLVLSTIEFHTSGQPSSAMIRCERDQDD